MTTCCYSGYYCSTSAPEPIPVQQTIFNSYTYAIGHIYECPSSAAAPAGAVDCDGAEVSRAVYSELFTYANDNGLVGPGLLYGPGDGSTTFNLPDLSPTDSAMKYVVQYTTASSTTISDRKVVVFTVPGAGASGDIVLQVQDSSGNSKEGRFAITLRFVDSASTISDPTMNPFTTPGVAEFGVITDSDGSYTLAVAETGTWKVLYLVAELGGECFTSTAITLGHA